MKKLIVLGVILGGILLSAMYVISLYTTTRNEGRHEELALTAKYKAVMVSYGQDRLAFTDQLGIAREKRDAMDKILVDAVAGRYNKPGSPQVDNGKFFSAIKEAYPDISGVGIYDKILDFVTKMRNKFATDQTQIQNMVRDYNEWRTTGSFLHPWIVNLCGFPSDSLEVIVNGKTYHGKEALDMMSRPIVGSDTNQIFDSGTDQPVMPTNNK